MFRLLVPLVGTLLCHSSNSFVLRSPISTGNTGCHSPIVTSALRQQKQAADDWDPQQQEPTDQELSHSDGSILFKRRDAMTASRDCAILLSTMLLGSPLAEAATDGAAGIGADPKHPVVILGAGGQCGKLCTQILISKGLYVLATTRDGRAVLKEDSPFVTYASCDITKETVVNQALSGASGVIFAASASGKAKGGVARDVDYIGAMNTATACIQQKVPKLVLLSAGTVTRPDAPAFKQTNYFVKDYFGEKFMDYKIAGESAVRDIYAAQKQQGGKGQLGYTIIRPGALNGRPSKGPAKLHLSQGDIYSSEISREDVALVTVEALLKGKDTDFVTFELNQIGGLKKCIASLDDLPSELVHAGAPTFSELLGGLVTDSDMKAKYPNVVNDFRGDIVR
ncbi:unnamed protein product [Cylindrotheca closterium]|uniref:NAD(P)-binding domain-containing protein n=1 Tax=Cylindrotheca closterium TaxID=2856 RepID=A0AAD2FSJ7_9STRA|nr:unnamed protein product [Cylindrotheca closterium]